MIKTIWIKITSHFVRICIYVLVSCKLERKNHISQNCETRKIFKINIRNIGTFFVKRTPVAEERQIVKCNKTSNFPQNM